MPTLEKLYSLRGKERLTQAVDKRFSCRAFGQPLSLQDWSALSYIAGRYTLPGARLALLRVEEALFSGTLLSMNRVSGCTAVAVVVADQAIRNSRIHAGMLGESLCLEATALGIASCWITGSYRRKLLQLPLYGREAALGIIALGWPQNPPPMTRRRKSLTGICTSDPLQWPEECLQAARLVQQAPSAMNLQPWMLSWEQGLLAVDCGERTLLDLGIALCHAELALRTPHTWQYAKTSREPAAFTHLNSEKEA